MNILPVKARRFVARQYRQITAVSGSKLGKRRGSNDRPWLQGRLTMLQDLSGLSFQHPAQQFDIFGDLVVDGFQLFDLAHRVNDRGVIAPAKPSPDFGQGF